MATTKTLTGDTSIADLARSTRRATRSSPTCSHRAVRRPTCFKPVRRLAIKRLVKMSRGAVHAGDARRPRRTRRRRRRAGGRGGCRCRRPNRPARPTRRPPSQLPRVDRAHQRGPLHRQDRHRDRRRLGHRPRHRVARRPRGRPRRSPSTSARSASTSSSPSTPAPTSSRSPPTSPTTPGVARIVEAAGDTHRRASRTSPGSWTT